MTNFATDPGTILDDFTPAEMSVGLVCGDIQIEKLNWLFRQLFAPLPLTTDAIATNLCSNAIFIDCVTDIIQGFPRLTQPFTARGVVGAVLSRTFGTVQGTGPLTLTASALPVDVTFTDNGNGTYNLTGLFPPTGTYTYSVTATNSVSSIVIPGNTIVTGLTPIAPLAAPFIDTGLAGSVI